VLGVTEKHNTQESKNHSILPHESCLPFEMAAQNICEAGKDCKALTLVLKQRFAKKKKRVFQVAIIRRNSRAKSFGSFDVLL